eukprot:TRINITY_DN6472_c0_g1_i1.p3 TRINITY_DN6472_c0_g1~~TRINITY_DN6472_c0_g1_i1.p3  ORF type:complete len:104 (-),score=2.58 TRINITY_DN6472_c0_g1_i1:233-544(-)
MLTNIVVGVGLPRVVFLSLEANPVQIIGLQQLLHLALVSSTKLMLLVRPVKRTLYATGALTMGLLFALPTFNAEEQSTIKIHNAHLTFARLWKFLASPSLSSF